MREFSSIKGAQKAAKDLNKKDGIGYRKALDIVANQAGFPHYNALKDSFDARPVVSAQVIPTGMVPVLTINGEESGLLRPAPGLMDDVISFSRLMGATQIRFDLLPDGIRSTLRMFSVDQPFLKFAISHWAALRASAEHYLDWAKGRFISGPPNDRIIIDLQVRDGGYPRLWSEAHDWRRISGRTGTISVIASPDGRLLKAMLFDHMSGYAGPDPVKFADVTSTQQILDAKDAAEQGRAVFLTMRAKDGKEAIDRIASMDPGYLNGIRAVDLVRGVMSVRAIRTLCGVCQGMVGGCPTCMTMRYGRLTLLVALEDYMPRNMRSSSTSDCSWRVMTRRVKDMLLSGDTDVAEVNRVFSDVMSGPEIDSLQDFVDSSPREKRYSFRSPVTQPEYDRLMDIFIAAR